jgi:DNA-binding IclR family transcriptional regulator
MSVVVPLRRSRVSGIDRALQVLDLLMERGSAATAYDIARLLNAPTSTIYDVIETLVERDLLTRSVDGLVSLGPKLYFYGLAYARDLDQSDVLRTHMQALSNASGETVQICGRDDDRMVVLMMEQGPGHFGISSKVGSRVPLNWTASGRLLIGALPEPERRELVARAEPSATGRAEVNGERLLAQAAESWASGLAVQIGEADQAIACIAAPIRKADGSCPFTVSVVVPAQRAQDSLAGLADLVRSAARDIEFAMGWRQKADD